MEMVEQGELSPSMPVPLRFQRRGYGGDDFSNHRQLVAVTPTTPIATASGFKFPDGWTVQEVRRSNKSSRPSRIDKYYYEPGTGHKFRSLRAVERYMKGEEYTPGSRDLQLYSRVKSLVYRRMIISNGKSPAYRKMIISNGKMLRLDENASNQYQLAIADPTISSAASSFNLPDGWVVEEVPRKGGGFSDKYYYEPGTGRKFRSLVAVEKHLAELKENRPLSEVLAELKEYNTPLCKAFKHVKNNMSREKVQSSTFISPPTKIKWVLASSGGDAWNPFIRDMPVPESVKQQWAKRFMLAIK